MAPKPIDRRKRFGGGKAAHVIVLQMIYAGVKAGSTMLFPLPGDCAGNLAQIPKRERRGQSGASGKPGGGQTSPRHHGVLMRSAARSVTLALDAGRTG
ncbi:MAG: hypothetical protein ACO3WM_08365 [Gemmobacter sp.]